MAVDSKGSALDPRILSSGVLAKEADTLPKTIHKEYSVLNCQLRPNQHETSCEFLNE